MAPRRIAPERLAPVRAAAQLLHRPLGLTHPAEIAREIGGAQAQDARAGRLTFRARNSKLTAADVDRARTEERSLLLTWAMRNTLHLLNAEDAIWMLPLFRPRFESFARRRLEHFGVGAGTQDRALDVIKGALEADGPLPRGEVVERLRRRRIKVTPESRLHFTFLAVATGIACLGPDLGRTTMLASAHDWLGEPPRHDREAALRDLARRYLGAFGPATDADFAGWAGLPLGEIRLGLGGIAGELRESRIGEQPAWALKRSPRRAPGGVVRLLPAWDTYLLGHRDRSFLARPSDWKRIWIGGGMYVPAIVVDGVAVGTWAIRGRRDLPEVTVDAFERLDRTTAAAVEAETADVHRFEGTKPE